MTPDFRKSIILWRIPYFARLSFRYEQHVVTDEYGVSVEIYWQGKPKCWQKALPQCRFVHYKFRTELGSNPVLRGDRPANNSMGHERAFYFSRETFSSCFLWGRKWLPHRVSITNASRLRTYRILILDLWSRRMTVQLYHIWDNTSLFLQFQARSDADGCKVQILSLRGLTKN
jgi:hypothetical protein